MKKEISIDEMRTIEVEMLCDIHQFCVNNSLRYYLIGGTLLGAIRHKGFIPWDDDIDIAMPRVDYEKFLELYGKNFEGRYSVLNIRTNEKVFFPFTKIIDNRTIAVEEGFDELESGVWIDIFPMDKMSDDYDAAKRLFNHVYHYRKAVAACTGPLNVKASFMVIIKNLALKLMYAHRGLPWILNRINSLAIKYQYLSTSKYICVVVMGTYGISEILESDCFSDAILVPFENNQFYAPVGYHKVLTHLYGDYMQLPPEEKRKSHHNFTAWWKEG